MDVQKLILARREIEKEISSLNKKLGDFNKELKNINQLIFKNCEHNWIKDYNYYTYDERHYRCTICNMIKN